MTDSRYIRKMEASAPSSPGEAAVYWANLAQEEAEKSLRYGKIAMFLMLVAVALFVVSLVVRIVFA